MNSYLRAFGWPIQMDDFLNYGEVDVAHDPLVTFVSIALTIAIDVAGIAMMVWLLA